MQQYRNGMIFSDKVFVYNTSLHQDQISDKVFYIQPNIQLFAGHVNNTEDGGSHINNICLIPFFAEKWNFNLFSGSQTYNGLCPP